MTFFTQKPIGESLHTTMLVIKKQAHSVLKYILNSLTFGSFTKYLKATTNLYYV